MTGIVNVLGRSIGLDVHLDFCELAICEEGKVRSAGRVKSTPEALNVLAESLLPTDRVALEVTGSAWEIVRILEPHVARVIVVSPGDTGISQARAKTDRLDARTLAKLLWAGELEAVWRPDDHTRVLRRRLQRRAQLVRARSRAKNEVHAVLMRRLVGRCPFADLFGVKGRRWLRQLELPVEECETVEGCMRQIEFLDAEIEEVERLIAKQTLRSPEARHLLTVPGVNVICAATFLAAIGDIGRFKTSRELVGYLGLDPKVRQSGSEPARGGRISKQGSPQARWALVEAAWSVVQQPGPMHAFYERIRARRGFGVAAVATNRPIGSGARRTGLTGGNLRPSASRPRPIRRPKSAQIPFETRPRTLDFHPSSEGEQIRAPRPTPPLPRMRNARRTACGITSAGWGTSRVAIEAGRLGCVAAP